jgi:hypothetical protein
LACVTPDRASIAAIACPRAGQIPTFSRRIGQPSAAESMWESSGGLRCLFKSTAGFVRVLELMLGQGADAQVQGRANLLGSFLEDHNLLDHDFAAVLAQVEQD